MDLCSEDIELLTALTTWVSFYQAGVHLSFVKANKTLFGESLKAIQTLLYIAKDTQVPVNIMFNLFDSFVGSILKHSCGVWGLLL